MSNLLQTIQSIAINAVAASNPASLCYGVVTSAKPLKIRLDESTLEISDSAVMLTESVVERKITIDKHNHTIGSALVSHQHSYVNAAGTTTDTASPIKTPGLTDKNTVDNTVLSVHFSEFGQDLTDKQVESDSDKVTITTTRALEKDDKVLMLRLMGGQKFVVLSRLFLREGEDDED